MGIKADGERCTRQDNGFINLTAHHLNYCSTHWPVYDRHVTIRAQHTVVVAEQHHRAGTCHKWVADERWCGRHCEGEAILCETHFGAAETRRQRRQVDTALQDRVDQLYNWYRTQPITWRQQMNHMFEHHRAEEIRILFRVAHRYFRNTNVLEREFNAEWQFDQYWRWAINGRVGQPPNLVPPIVMPAPPPQLRNGLAAIARDVQNVHTRVVSEQTNKGLEKLLEASKDSRALRAPEWIAARWLTRGYGNWNDVARTVTDMKQWYDRPFCKTANDWLYRRALDGLYITLKNIKDPELQIELFKRTFEECFESVSMCCEGHISRVCNVLVGFDDAFAPPVPFGEILQNKMAAIYAMEVDTEKKVALATDFFNEFAVPEAERGAWLEAF